MQRKIDKEIGAVNDSMLADCKKRVEGLNYFLSIPNDGKKSVEILELIDTHLAVSDYKWKEGRVSGAVYNYSEELTKLMAAVYEKTSYTNPLHPDVFPGINKMEAEVVRMSAALFRGDANSCGTVRLHVTIHSSEYSSPTNLYFLQMTTGGTESIMMACKAYRDYGREVSGINRPNMVLPRTAHTAFDKAAQYLGIHVRYVDIDPETAQVDLSKMERKINRNTIMVRSIVVRH